MIYDLWNSEPPSNMELEERILELAKKLGQAYDWKRTAPSVISAVAWKIVQDIARGGQSLTDVDEHCKNFLTDFATKMVEDGFSVEEELRKLETKQGRLDAEQHFKKTRGEEREYYF